VWLGLLSLTGSCLLTSEKPAASKLWRNISDDLFAWLEVFSWIVLRSNAELLDCDENREIREIQE